MCLSSDGGDKKKSCCFQTHTTPGSHHFTLLWTHLGITWHFTATLFLSLHTKDDRHGSLQTRRTVSHPFFIIVNERSAEVCHLSACRLQKGNIFLLWVCEKQRKSVHDLVMSHIFYKTVRWTGNIEFFLFVSNIKHKFGYFFYLCVHMWECMFFAQSMNRWTT